MSDNEHKPKEEFTSENGWTSLERSQAYSRLGELLKQGMKNIKESAILLYEIIQKDGREYVARNLYYDAIDDLGDNLATETQLMRFGMAVDYIREKMLESQINLNLYHFQPLQIEKHGDDSYDKRFDITKHVNQFLRENNLEIRHPDTGSRCTLLLVRAQDGNGRYVLQDRRTKKRSCTSKFIHDLLPFRLSKALPRREGFLTSKEEAEGDNFPESPTGFEDTFKWYERF